MSANRRLFVVAAAILAPAAFAAAPKPDIENGKAKFDGMCGICHSVAKEGGPLMGPNLMGIVGSKAASDPTFPMYTPALKASRLTWNAKTLDEFIADPAAKVQGTMMPVRIEDAKDRADIVAYLATIKK